MVARKRYWRRHNKESSHLASGSILRTNGLRKMWFKRDWSRHNTLNTWVNLWTNPTWINYTKSWYRIQLLRSNQLRIIQYLRIWCHCLKTLSIKTFSEASDLMKIPQNTRLYSSWLTAMTFVSYLLHLSNVMMTGSSMEKTSLNLTKLVAAIRS